MANLEEIKAHVDLETGKIHGCKPGTRKWFHEEGHLVFNNDPNKSFWIMIIDFMDYLWKFAIMLAIIARPLVYLAVLLWSIPMFWIIYEEAWCNKYADKKYKEVQKNEVVEINVLKKREGECPGN